jgi:L-lactate permease
LHVEPKITFEQFNATVSAMRKSTSKTKWLRIALIVVFSFSIVIMAKTSSNGQFPAIISITLLALFIFGLFAKYIAHWCLKRSYKTQEKQFNEQHMDLSETGISGHSTDGTVSYRYDWSAFERSIELPDAFLFLPNKTSFIRIPKDVLSTEQIRELKRWVVQIPTTPPHP